MDTCCKSRTWRSAFLLDSTMDTSPSSAPSASPTGSANTRRNRQPRVEPPAATLENSEKRGVIVPAQFPAPSSKKFRLSSRPDQPVRAQVSSRYASRPRCSRAASQYLYSKKFPHSDHVYRGENDPPARGLREMHWHPHADNGNTI